MDKILPEELQIALTKGYSDLVLFAEVFLGMPLHEGQKRFLREGNAKTNVLVPANRWGKSTVIAIKHIHHCFYKIGIPRGNSEAWARASYTTVNLSPHTDTTKPVFETILAIMRSSYLIRDDFGKSRSNDCIIGWFLNDARIRNTPPLYIAFVNNSDILFRSTGEDQGKSIEGRSYGYISYDEGGQSHHLGYEHKRRIIPRLGELDGQFDLISTPETSSPSILEHYELFQKGGGDSHPREEGFYSQEGSIEENIYFLRANPHYVADTLLQFAGDPVVDQVLYGKFVFAGDNIFPAPDILDAQDNELNGGVGYEEGHSYVVGIDTAMGEDEMVYTVMDTTKAPYRVVRQIACKGNSKSPQIHMDDFTGLVHTYKRLNNLKIILETWNGESARFYQDMPYDLQLVTKCFGSWQPQGVKVVGRNPRNVKKAEILLALRKLLAVHDIKLPNESTLIKQLSIYREDDTNLPTDRVISLALACWLATDGKPKNPNIQIEYVNWF